MSYQIYEVDGNSFIQIINEFNKKHENWPDLEQRHFDNGYWWLVYFEDVPIAFAGLVPLEPFPKIGYLKRCYVNDEHRGHSLQQRLLLVRETKARELGWTHLVSDAHRDNKHSANNFRRANYQIVEPEQKWEVDSLYWIKEL